MATTGISFFIRRWRWVPRTLRTSSSSAFSLSIFRWMWRRSVSNWVSPGPLEPMGPLPLVPAWRSRWVHMPVSRGSRYWYWASSTWRRPSLVLARWAKMSRIRPLRSRTWTPSSWVSTRIWEGLRSLSKMTMVASSLRTSSRISATLPSPMKVRGSGAARFWSTTAATSPPAVSTRAPSSSRVSSSALSRLSSRGLLSPASTARSRGFSTSVCTVFFSSIVPRVLILPCKHTANSPCSLCGGTA